jgi:hypothetical protein
LLLTTLLLLVVVVVVRMNMGLEVVVLVAIVNLLHKH